MAYIAKARPRAFVLENVLGLRSQRRPEEGREGAAGEKFLDKLRDIRTQHCAAKRAYVVKVFKLDCGRLECSF